MKHLKIACMVCFNTHHFHFFIKAHKSDTNFNLPVPGTGPVFIKIEKVGLKDFFSFDE